MISIEICSGNSKKHIEYEVWLTNAPANYDGFGTIRRYDARNQSDDEPASVVLIRAEHVRWQVDRYSSGPYVAVKNDKPYIEEDAVRFLLERICAE